MSERNYWQRMRRQRLSRRALLGASARAGVGAAGLALVGCGDGGDDQQQAAPAPSSSAAQQQQQQQQDQPAATAQAQQQQQEQQAEAQAQQQEQQEAAAQAQAQQEAQAEATASDMWGSQGVTPKYGGWIVEQSANVYETVDSQRTVASPVLQVLARVQSKLLRFANPNRGILAGDLAESWETPDDTTVVLNMRPGVKWHNAGPGAANPASAAGRDFTPGDVVWNINRQKNKVLEDGTESPDFGRSSYWGGADVLGLTEESVTLQLAASDPTFILGLANEFNLFNQPELTIAYEDSHTEIAADKVIGTGPFILTRWEPGEGISAVKNPDFYGLPERPYLDAYVWVQTFQDPNAYRIAFEQKQVDSMTDPNPNTIQAIHEASGGETWLAYNGVANTVAVFTPSNKDPWRDLRMVRAIDAAIDRRQLIQQLHSGFGRVSGPITWMQEAWALPDEELSTFAGYRVDKDEDRREAKQLWDAAGGSEVGQIDWVTSQLWASRAAWSATPGIIATMFNEAFDTDQFNGITKPYLEIIPSWNNNDFDPFFSWIPNIELPDARPEILAAFGTGGGSNYWEISDEWLDDQLTDALQDTDYDSAYEKMAEAQRYILERGQFGRNICYNYIVPVMRYNYNWAATTNRAEGSGWNFLANSVHVFEQWLDTDDPSIQGREPEPPVPL